MPDTLDYSKLRKDATPAALDYGKLKAPPAAAPVPDFAATLDPAARADFPGMSDVEINQARAALSRGMGPSGVVGAMGAGTGGALLGGLAPPDKSIRDPIEEKVRHVLEPVTSLGRPLEEHLARQAAHPDEELGYLSGAPSKVGMDTAFNAAFAIPSVGVRALGTVVPPVERGMDWAMDKLRHGFNYGSSVQAKPGGPDQATLDRLYPGGRMIPGTQDVADVIGAPALAPAIDLLALSGLHKGTPEVAASLPYGDVIAPKTSLLRQLDAARAADTATARGVGAATEFGAPYAAAREAIPPSLRGAAEEGAWETPLPTGEPALPVEPLPTATLIGQGGRMVEPPGLYPTGLDARLAKAGLTRETAIDAVRRGDQNALQMVRPADLVDLQALSRAPAAALPPVATNPTVAEPGIPPAPPVAAAPRTAFDEFLRQAPAPDPLEALQARAARDAAQVPGRPLAQPAAPTAPVPQAPKAGAGEKVGPTLLPKPGEGTVPTVEERQIAAAGGPGPVAKATGREVVTQPDGQSALVPPAQVPEAQALAAKGTLPELVNGAGNATKPPAPTTAVTAKDAAGNEARTVLTDSTEKTAAASAKQVELGLTPEVKPATPEVLEQTLAERGNTALADPNSNAGQLAMRAKPGEVFDPETLFNTVDSRGTGGDAQARVVPLPDGRFRAEFREGFEVDAEPWAKIAETATFDEGLAAIEQHTRNANREPATIDVEGTVVEPTKALPEKIGAGDKLSAEAAEAADRRVQSAAQPDRTARQSNAVADALDRVAKGEDPAAVGADLERSMPELADPAEPEMGTEGRHARSQFEAALKVQEAESAKAADGALQYGEEPLSEAESRALPGGDEIQDDLARIREMGEPAKTTHIRGETVTVGDTELRRHDRVATDWAMQRRDQFADIYDGTIGGVKYQFVAEPSGEVRVTPPLVYVEGSGGAKPADLGPFKSLDEAVQAAWEHRGGIEERDVTYPDMKTARRGPDGKLVKDDAGKLVMDPKSEKRWVSKAPAKPVVEAEAPASPPSTSGTSTPERIGAGEPKIGERRPRATGAPGSEGTFPVKDINIDAKRFQFKEAVNEKGETGDLAHVQKAADWLRTDEGVITVWRDPADGKVYVTDGHQRTNAAKRAGTPEVLVRFSDAPTAEAAMLEAAEMNLRSGSVKASDAARFFRLVGKKGAELEAYMREKRISPKRKQLREGRALANLTDDLWDRYRRNEIDEGKAIAIGETGASPDIQGKLAKSAASPAEIPALARRMAESAPTKKLVEGDMFSADTSVDSSLYETEATLETALLKGLNKEKRALRSAVENKSTIERVGTLDSDAATKIAEDTGTLADVAREELKFRGPLRDAITAAAKDVNSGALTTKDAVTRLRAESTEILSKQHPELRGALEQAAKEAEAPSEPTLFGGRADRVGPREAPTKSSVDAAEVPLAAPEAAKVKAPPFEKPPEKPEKFGRRGETGAVGVGVRSPSPDVPRERVPAPQHVQDALDAVKQKIRFGPEKPSPIGERITNAWHKFYDKWLRKEGAIGRLERDLTGTISDTGPTRIAQRAQGGAAGRAREFYEEGNLETYPEAKSVRDALAEVTSAPLADVAAYSVSKRIETGYIPRRLAHGFNATSTHEIVNYFENTPAHADVVRAANAIHEHYDTLLHNLAAAEGWPQERYDAIRQANPFYVRFLRILGEGADEAPVKGGVGKPFPPKTVPRVKGGEQPLADPTALIASDTRKFVAAADQARVRRAVLEMIRKHPEQAQGIVEVMEPADVAKSFPKFDEIARAMEKPDQSGVARGHYATDPEMWAEMHDLYEEGLRGKVLFDFSGKKPVALKVLDPSLADALAANAPGAEILMNALPTKIAGKVTALQRAGITQLAPRFALRNPIRDLVTYYHYSDAPIYKMPLRIVQGFVHSLAGQLHDYVPSIVPESKWTNLYKRAGVEGFFDMDKGDTHADLGWMEAKGLAAKARHLGRPIGGGEGVTLGGVAAAPFRGAAKLSGKLLDVLRDANQSVEGMYRYAEMIETAQRRGITPDKFTDADLTAIAAKAGDVTLNFRLGGEYAKVANRYEAFLNAQIQGLVRAGSEWKSSPARMAARAVPVVVAKAALWAYIQSKDDLREEYDRLAPWRKLLWNLPYHDKEGNARFVSLPGPSELMALPNVVEIGLNAFQKEDPETAKKMAGDMAKSLIPGGGMMAGPSVVRPAVEVHNDESEFTGRSINPAGTERQAEEAPETVIGPSTSPAARRVSEALAGLGLKWTPPEIDHLIRGYFGSVGRDVVSSQADVESADDILTGSFHPRTGESRWVDDFYKLKGRVEGQRGAFRSLQAEGSDRKKEFRGAMDMPPEVSQLADALGVARERLRAAKTEADRLEIAKHADVLAQTGIRILGRLLKEPQFGVGEKVATRKTPPVPEPAGR